MSDQYAPPPGPPPGYCNNAQDREQASMNPYHSAHSSAYQAQQASSSGAPPAYEAPPGPPPNWQGEKKQHQGDEYTAPPGPPPSWSGNQRGYSEKEDYAPPPRPPPSHQQANQPEPPPYDPWMAVPDNALLPPPPSTREETSPTANATYDDAARGHAWCRQNPLWQPRQHPNHVLQSQSTGKIRLTAPPKTSGIDKLDYSSKGGTHIKTDKKCGDTIFLSELPLYAAYSPGQLPRTVYYELKVLSMGHPEGDAGIAIGFVAPPYPSWRLPGWHRASLGIHGDDGRRYVDDSYGGKNFVKAFKKGDVVGVGMIFSPPVYQGGKMRVEVFFTRNEKKEGGWDLHEERDRDVQEGDVTGLEGQHDLLAAVGCFGGVEFETRLAHSDWKFRL